MPSSELLRVFAALEQARVRYVVVGGVAVVLHGHMRVTADLDVVVGLEPANARAPLRALGDLGYRPRAPVPLEHFADPRSLADLIALKRAAGRSKDLDDAAALAAIQAEDRDG